MNFALLRVKRPTRKICWDSRVSSIPQKAILLATLLSGSLGGSRRPPGGGTESPALGDRGLPHNPAKSSRLRAASGQSSRLYAWLAQRTRTHQADRRQIR